MQQSGNNDIQLLQQHLLLKQLQELQRQQQLPQLCNVRQNSFNYPFAATKQAVGDIPQLPLSNGTYLTDTSQLLANWENRGAFPFVQGLPNRLSPSADQGQVMHLTGLLPQGVGASIYSSPVPESHPIHLRGISPETANLANKIIDHQQTLSILQPSASSTTFTRDQLAVSSGQVCMPEGSYMYKQDYIGQNMFGELPPQSHNSGLFPGTLQPDNIMQTSASVQEFGWKQDQADWPGNMQSKLPQMIPLDPLEKKILYNSDDSAWDSCFGKYSDIVPGGSGNPFEPMDTLPSLHSGSWSALMQSAVAETSSGETGLTEEWSGLTYQNPENSTDNQPSVMDSGRQHTGWADNSLQSPFSLTSSPVPAFNNSIVSPSIPVFQTSSVQSSSNQHAGLHQDVSHGAVQRPVTNAIEWLDRYSVQKPSLQWSQHLQPHLHMNAWSAQNYEYSEGDKILQTIPSHDDSRRSLSQEKGENKGTLLQVPNASDAPGNENTTSVYAVDNRRLTRELDQLQSEASIFTLNREESKLNNFMGIQNSCSERFQQEAANQHKQAQNQPNEMSQVDIPMYVKETTSTERNPVQIVTASVLCHSLNATNEIYPMENVKDKFSGGERVHLNASDSGMNLAKEAASSGRDLKEPDGIASGIYPPQSYKSFTFDGSAGSRGANITALRSLAEKEWAEAINRLIEKLEGELERIKDKWPKLRAKRRLLLSTQLMQQLLRAAPTSMLSINAASIYDSLAYFVAKATIGDACRLASCHNSDSCMHSSDSNRIHEKVETFERSDDEHFTKAVEDFMSRAKKLEDVLTRLEKAAPVLDICLENQELERYSVINRFAKFHIRGPATSSKMSTGSGVAPTVPRSSLQTQVTAHPPLDTPHEGVKCLSL